MPGRWVFGSRKDFLHAEEKKVVAESRASVASATTFLRELAALPPPPEIAGDDAEIGPEVRRELAALPVGPVHTQARRPYTRGRATTHVHTSE